MQRVAWNEAFKAEVTDVNSLEFSSVNENMHVGKTDETYINSILYIRQK